MSSSNRIAVVGGGILGISVARRLAQLCGDHEVIVFEKEDRLSSHQTGHNSGVVHAGVYYPPGSLKALLCREGASLLEKFTAERGLEFRRCGKVVVATREAELPGLHRIFKRAVSNAVPGARLVDARELAELEPAATGVAAIHSPATAIVDYPAITRALAADLIDLGGNIRLGTEVESVSQERNGARVTTAGGAEQFALVITCAGLQADRLARRSGDLRYPIITPFFGDYYQMTPDKEDLVNGMIYPVPDPRYPFLGVHLTRKLDGGLLVGPNAFVSMAREGYRRHAFSARDSAELLGSVGFWRFVRANHRAGFRELRTGLSRAAFAREASRYVPGIESADLQPGPRGVRAQALGLGGELIDDFVITGTDRIIHVRNAPSPAATSALAIAGRVVDRAFPRRTA